MPCRAQVALRWVGRQQREGLSHALMGQQGEDRLGCHFRDSGIWGHLQVSSGPQDNQGRESCLLGGVRTPEQGPEEVISKY